jgi:hypothetical protein
MIRTSTLTTAFLLFLIYSTSVVAQEQKHWSFGGAVGTTNDLSLSYDITSQLQVSIISGIIIDTKGSQPGYDRLGLSVIYFFDTTNNPFFIGFSPGMTYQSPKSFIAIVPLGVQHKLNDDVRIRIAAEGFRKFENINNVTGLGVLIGASVYF